MYQWHSVFRGAFYNVFFSVFQVALVRNPRSVRQVFREYGDKVRTWVTFNEVWTFTALGHTSPRAPRETERHCTAGGRGRVQDVEFRNAAMLRFSIIGQ